MYLKDTAYTPKIQRRYTPFSLRKIHAKDTPKWDLGAPFQAAVSSKWDLGAGRGSTANGEMEAGRVHGPAMWNGRAVLVTLSEESETGFLNVQKQPGGRKKPFYVKFKPDGEKRQRMLPGSSSATAWEAA